MKGIYSYLLLLSSFLIVLVFQKCIVNNDPALDLLKFEDIVCTSVNKITQDSANDDYFNDWSLVGTNLILDFRFTAVCFAAFKDSVILGNNSIHIFLEDTSSVHARCLCEHHSIFSFTIPDVNKIRLLLDIKSYTSETYYNRVDTLLQLY